MGHSDHVLKFKHHCARNCLSSRCSNKKVVYNSYTFHYLFWRSPVLLIQPLQYQKRCQGTTLALSYQRSPMAGRARHILTSSTALWSLTSAIPDMSWLALKSSCASGISHGAVMCRDVKKVRGSSQCHPLSFLDKIEKRSWDWESFV